MFPKFSVITVLALIALVGQSEAQDGCVAQPVIALMISNNQMISWVVQADEPCEITEFLINVWEARGPEEYSFSVTEHWADLSFLTACEEYVYVVQPVSYHTRGRGSRLFGQLPLGPDDDLSIKRIDIVNNSTIAETHLHWNIDEKYANCTLEYRVTIEESGQPVVGDIYTTNTSLNLHFLSPCVTYQFGVRAINIGIPTVEGPLRLAFSHIPGHVQGPPRIIDLEQGAHYVNISFSAESKVRNSCPITMFYVDGGASFEREMDLNDDDFRRAPINVSIHGLQPNSMYFFKASVRNEAGWSQANSAAFQTLEED